MKDHPKLLGACGIDCASCDIRVAAGDPKSRQIIVDWFRETRHEEVPPETIRCTWCKGERTGHWSADCWILRCCVDCRGLAFCNECPDFPCPRLVEWATEDEGYGRALERLRSMVRRG